MSEIVTSVLLVIGSLFMLLAGVGVFRFPDVYLRIQATAKASTLGPLCILGAVALHFGDVATVTRAGLVAAFIFVTVPVSSHMIARAAHSIGTPLWEGSISYEGEDKPMDGKPASADGASTGDAAQ